MTDPAPLDPVRIARTLTDDLGRPWTAEVHRDGTLVLSNSSTDTLLAFRDLAEVRRLAFSLYAMAVEVEQRQVSDAAKATEARRAARAARADAARVTS